MLFVNVKDSVCGTIKPFTAYLTFVSYKTLKQKVNF